MTPLLTAFWSPKELLPWGHGDITSISVMTNDSMELYVPLSESESVFHHLPATWFWASHFSSGPPLWQNGDKNQSPHHGAFRRIKWSDARKALTWCWARGPCSVTGNHQDPGLPSKRQKALQYWQLNSTLPSALSELLDIKMEAQRTPKTDQNLLSRCPWNMGPLRRREHFTTGFLHHTDTHCQVPEYYMERMG